jgi:hypothetical protein
LSSLPLAATAAALLLLLVAITSTLAAAATIAALTLALVATALAAWGTPLTAVATAAAAVVATTAAATSVAAASVATATAAATATASGTIRCLVDADGTTVKFDVVHVLHGSVGLSIRGVTDEAETPAAASVAVLDDDSLLYLAELLELRTQSDVIGVPRKTSYEELRHGDLKKH